MRVCNFACVALLALDGCAGLEMKTITSDDVDQARKGKVLHGYVVYEPIIVIEISEREVCVEKGDKDCKKSELRCAASTPFLLPDYEKPYLITSKSGFGKAGVDLTIADGWRLGNIKDSSDNTALLDFIGKAALNMFNQRSPNDKCKPGLYRLPNKGLTLVPFQSP